MNDGENSKLSDFVAQLAVLQEMANELTDDDLPKMCLDRVKENLEYTMIAIVKSHWDRT